RPLLPRTFNFFSQMAGENAQSRIYLGIHYEFDAIEGIRCGDGIGDYVFTHSLTPQRGPGPVMPSMDPLQQVRLAVLLEDVAADHGLQINHPNSAALVIANVFLNPSVVSHLMDVASNPPPAQPSALSSTTAPTSGHSAAGDAIFWWDFKTGRSYS